MNDQEGHELADMSSAPYPGLAIDPRSTRKAHHGHPQTWRQLFWRLVDDLYLVLVSLAAVMVIAVGLYYSPAIWDVICSWIFPEMGKTNSSSSDMSYSSTTPSSGITPTTSPLTSTANRFNLPHHARIRQYSTSSVDATSSDSTTSLAWVPGLYLIPMPVSPPRESIMLQSPSLSGSSRTMLQKPPLQEHGPHPFATFSSISTTTDRKATSQAGKHLPFVFGGVTILPSSDNISFRDHLMIFCVRNVCSPNNTLASMCNNGVPEAEYERQECEWCWNNSSHVMNPNGTALLIHCKKVVDHSVKTLWIVGSLCLLPLVIISIILLKRCIASQKRKRAAAKRFSKSTQSFKPGKSGGDRTVLAPTGGNNDKDRELAKKKPKRCRLLKMRRKAWEEKQGMDITATDDRDLIMRPDIPHSIDTEIFSNIRGMGQGKLLEGSNSQEDSLGLSRTESRRERVLQSRNATVPTILVHRAGGSSSSAEVQAGPDRAKSRHRSIEMTRSSSSEVSPLDMARSC